MLHSKVTEWFSRLPDSTKVRAIFHPVALAATQLVSLSHFLFIPHSDYFNPLSIYSGLILGGAIAFTAEIVNRYLLKKERVMHENAKIVKYATNPLKTHLYVVEILPDGEAVFRFTNEAYKNRGTRDLPDDFIGKKYSEFHTPEETAVYCNQMVKVLELGKPLEDEKISRSGRISKRSLTTHVDIESGRKYVTVVSTDIRELKKLEKQLAEAAYHDALTGLANRRLLADRAELAKADLDRVRHDNGNVTCIGIVKMDLDNFKYYNDTYGHPGGDKLLVEVAKRLRGCVRSVDTVARDGGDEFTLLLPKTSKEGTVFVAKKILEEINRPYNLDDTECRLEVSVGVNFYPQDGKNLEELFKKADRALYRAKKTGKNTFCVFDEVKDKV